MARKTGADTIRVEGLDQLMRDLTLLKPELKKETRDIGRRIADKEVPRVKSAAEDLGSTAAHVSPGIMRAYGQDWAGIKLDAGRQPAILGAEFGGGHRPTTHQFQPWRGSGHDAGYFLWPTIRKDAAEIEAAYMDGIDAVLRKTGWRL